MRWQCLLIAIVLLADDALRADPPPASKSWPFDIILLRNGAVLKGLILETTDQKIKFQQVQRHPGRATVSTPWTVDRGEIDRIERLPPEQRAILQAHLQELEQNSPQAEKERMEGLDLEEISWNGKPGAGRRYSSDFFTLTSNAPDEIIRRAALRLEQIYVAYSRYLPPRHKGGAPTSVLLLTDKAEYQKQLTAQKLQILNPAFFDPAGNRIVCYSDLQRLGERLVEVRQHHRRVRAEIDAKLGELAKLYKGKELDLMRKPFEAARDSIIKADRKNDELFANATQQLFATLYHEAFHAYLASFVYPPQTGEVPRWLNEGLAQIFETAILDGQELRVGHADQARLAKAKDALQKGDLLPLTDLLRSGRDQFALSHIGERQVSDRHYVTSWALAFHLAFERRLLGSPALDRFIKQVNQGVDARRAFEELVGEPLAKFEPEFRKYVLYLQADGRVIKP